MECLQDECLKYLSNISVIDNIFTNYSKVVGIKSNLNILNENKKHVGKIILLSDAPKLYLNQIVEFNPEKIKWKSSDNNKDENGFYLVNRYWVKSYAPVPKIEVPVKVYDPRTKKFVIEIVNLNYYQFRKRKLLEFYRTWKYAIIAAYDNFNYLLKSKPYYYALNSTIKIYGIEQDDLKRAISIINNHKKQIKKEWNEHMNNHFQQNESSRMIDELYKQHSLEQSKDNVVIFKKKGII
jgi:hypothetical protein